MLKQKNQKIIPYICLLLAPLLWAGNYLMGRIMHGHIPPFGLTFFRWLVVVLILTPFLFRSTLKHMDYIRKKFLVLVLLSALSVVVYTSFVYLGLHYTTVVNGSLLNALVPVLIVLLSHFILSERLTFKKTIGLFLSLIGATVLILHGHLEQVTGVALNEGSLLIFIAAVAWALFSVLIKKIPKVLPPLTFLYVTAVIGCVMLSPCYIGERFMGNAMLFDIPTALSVLYASLISSILAFTFWSVGVHGVGPARASYFFNLLPVYSSLLAILVLGEHFYMYEAVGMILVFSGILFATVKFNVKGYAQVKGLV